MLAAKHETLALLPLILIMYQKANDAGLVDVIDVSIFDIGF
ncbi:hypothetical protein [Pseudoalteromonas shioyasakiensis]|nr:hypothetical protein [Pseudoalteromonas shioyasakiensis]